MKSRPPRRTSQKLRAPWVTKSPNSSFVRSTPIFPAICKPRSLSRHPKERGRSCLRRISRRHPSRLTASCSSLTPASSSKTPTILGQECRVLS
ncbi:hypothetical protein BV25DRAFT_1347913 [Artomyces pyxidatus]|uniref:Uncharacterized protein n=1 Tax=Artomyces pyxidatus TaxID=48021 RepID=A0ACB8SMW5_9AGAM|nr:hypothetical protein BV25DRAFT_1347913 [Artomyces pyxidatus]